MTSHRRPPVAAVIAARWRPARRRPRDRPRHREHPRLRPRPRHHAQRAVGRRASTRSNNAVVAVGAEAKRMIGRTPDHITRGAAAAGRRDRRLRRHRGDAALLRPQGAAPARRVHRPADRHLRPVRHHQRRAARGERVGLRGRRAAGAHHPRADGCRDRRRAAGQPAVRLDGRRHRRRHHRGRGPRARRHRRLDRRCGSPATRSTSRSSTTSAPSSRCSSASGRPRS